MISEKIVELLNEQINKEFYSAYLYLSMSAYLDGCGLVGFAHWTKLQAREEVEHGLDFLNYLIDRNAEVQLRPIAMPESSFKNALEMFEIVHRHEVEITHSINDIAAQSEIDIDRGTRTFIEKFILEQIEEEEQVRTIIDRLKLFGDDCTSLFMMDKEMGSRQD